MAKRKYWLKFLIEFISVFIAVVFAFALSNWNDNRRDRHTEMKGISELPYRFSKIKRTKNQYTSANSEFNDTLSLEFTIGKEIKEKVALDKWLTERYALFQDRAKWINEFEIHHLEWPISEITLSKFEFNYPRFKNLIKNEPDKIQYSKGVKVIAWGKNRRKKTSYK